MFFNNKIVLIYCYTTLQNSFHKLRFYLSKLKNICPSVFSFIIITECYSVCVRVYSCSYICVCVSVYLSISLCSCVNAYSLSVLVFVYVCKYVRFSVFIYIIYVYVCTSMCAWVCVSWVSLSLSLCFPLPS